MNGFDEQRRKEAIRALINIILLEAAVLMTVVMIYLNTNNITHLVGGVVAATLIFGPVFYRWIKAHGGALRRDGK